MARSKRSELAAGLFVVLALGAGLAVLLWLGASKIFGIQGQVVYFAAPIERGNLGLDIGSIVKIGNAWAGEVEEISVDLSNKRTIVRAKLGLKDARVHVNARANAVSEFIGGASIIIEDMGDPNQPLPTLEKPVWLVQGASAMLRQAQEMIGFGKEQQTQFQQILADASITAQKVKEITDTLATEMHADKADTLLSQVKKLIVSLQVTADNLAQMSNNLVPETNKKNPDSLLAKLDLTANSVAEFSKKDLGEILANLRKASTDVVTMVADLRAVSGTARELVVLNRDSLDGMVSNLSSTAANLNAASKEIRRNPWRLLQQPGDKDVRTQNIYDAVRAFSDGARQLDEALTRLKALREAQPQGVKVDDPEVVKVRQHLEETFKKFREAEDALWKELAK